MAPHELASPDYNERQQQRRESIAANLAAFQRAVGFETTVRATTVRAELENVSPQGPTPAQPGIPEPGVMTAHDSGRALQAARVPRSTVIPGWGVSRFFQPKKSKDMPKPKRTDRFVEKYPSEKGWRYMPPTLEFRDLMCCGVKEIHGIQNYHALHLYNEKNEYHGTSATVRVEPADIVERVKDWYNHAWHQRSRPFLIFTDNHLEYAKGEQYCGQRLVEYIVAHKLGKVFRTGKDRNGNSGAQIEMFTWNVNYPALMKHKPTFEEVK